MNVDNIQKKLFERKLDTTEYFKYTLLTTLSYE